MTKYIFRIDDVSEYMNFKKFERLEDIFLKNNVKSLVAVIPKNKDKKIMFEKHGRAQFVKKMIMLKKKGWTFAQHGYSHEFEGDGGLLGINDFGEFGGLSFDKQAKKIRKGKKILKKESLDSEIFVAPAHSFDYNTMEALKDENFTVVSDGIGLYPFEKRGLLFVPQITWRVRGALFGVITICLHPNEMKDNDFDRIEKFVEKNKGDIVDIDGVIKKYRRKGRFRKNLYKLSNFMFAKIWYLALRISK